MKRFGYPIYNYLLRVISLFVMYYIYGSVRAIPTYRVYRLYDIHTYTCALCQLYDDDNVHVPAHIQCIDFIATTSTHTYISICNNCRYVFLYVHVHVYHTGSFCSGDGIWSDQHSPGFAQLVEDGVPSLQRCWSGQDTHMYVSGLLTRTDELSLIIARSLSNSVGAYRSRSFFLTLQWFSLQVLVSNLIDM